MEDGQSENKQVQNSQPQVLQPGQSVSTQSVQQPVDGNSAVAPETFQSLSNAGPFQQVTVDAEPQSSDALISWTASEYIDHDKSAGWYGLLAVGTIVLATGIYLIMRDVVSVAAILACGLVFGVYAARKPQILQYDVDKTSIGIGPKRYNFEQFRSFSIVRDGAFASIVFMPMRRFAPPLTIYYDPADEDELVNIIATHLPIEERAPDPIDRLMRRIRF